jgi:hypothetical protein
MKFRKKPVVIDAFQWQGNFDALDEWLNWMGYSEDGDDGIEGSRPDGIYEDHNPSGDPLLVIPTLEGDMTALKGDWIIRGVKGEFYPCKPDIFAATYEPVDPASQEDPR